ncbi:MAG: BamA/TamA family outer membrane protein [bacterium]|nr:BamA/TamA family outer membrane protein [bacterium]
MGKSSLYRLIIFSSIIFISWIFSVSSAYAQASDTADIRQDRETPSLGTEEELSAGEVSISEDTSPIGIVDDIILTGDLVTSRSTVLRQMTFRIGDDISQHDLDLCKSRLLGFNGIYWQADITWVPSEVENHVIITVDLRGRRTWFLSPSQTGGTIGDRNIFGTGTSAFLSVYYSDENNHYYSLAWTDPQFLGGHNSMRIEGHVISGNNGIRSDVLLTTGESYHINRKGVRFDYTTNWNQNISVGLGYQFEDVYTNKRGDPFRDFGSDYHFFYSGTDINPGNVGVLNFNLSGGYLNSLYFPTDSYYWNWNSEFSNAFTLSDFNFTRHRIIAAYFHDLFKGRNVLCGRFMYSFMTGDPPHYELIPFDWQVRGYTLSSQRGQSMLAMNFEYRFIAEPDIFQGVVFADFGRAWEGNNFSLSDLEWGYGVGLRIYTLPFIPYNLLFRLDYGWGEYGNEFLFTFNQFF